VMQEKPRLPPGKRLVPFTPYTANPTAMMAATIGEAPRKLRGRSLRRLPIRGVRVQIEAGVPQRPASWLKRRCGLKIARLSRQIDHRSKGSANMDIRRKRKAKSSPSASGRRIGAAVAVRQEATREEEPSQEARGGAGGDDVTHQAKFDRVREAEEGRASAWPSGLP